jgi:tetratricopeptide (TPR) repeat protein
MRCRLLALSCLLAVTVPPAARADHEALGGEHGKVAFATSCAADVQDRFERAVANLHSFGFEVAAARFAEVAEADPKCGMAHWGIATSYYHPLWAAPTPAELAAGTAAAKKAAEVGAKTEREGAWIAAIGLFYADAETADHKTRATRYRDALAALAEKYPDDDEARIFHALMLLGTAPPRDATYAQQQRAVEELKPFVTKYPNHPGIAHYLIHSLDYPELAHLGLDSARRYARIAPSSPHALHMPSHIFVRLGLWPEAMASNLDSANSALALRVRFPVASVFDELHALDYLVYGYLQSGRDDDALAIVRRAEAYGKVDKPSFAAAYALAAAPVRYHLERNDWQSAAALGVLDAAAPLSPYPYTDAIPVYGRALGAARTGKLERAEAELARLATIQKALAASPPPGVYDWPGHVEATRLAAAGLVERAREKNDEAVRLLTAAAELDTKVGKSPVTPGTVLPPRELLADVLLEIGRAPEALAAYEATLIEAPNRLRALTGAARAAELAKQTDRARTLWNLVAAVAAPASTRPEVLEARKRLAGP